MTEEQYRIEELAAELDERILNAVNVEHKKMIAEIISAERLPLASDAEVHRLRNQVVELQDMLEKSRDELKDVIDWKEKAKSADNALFQYGEFVCSLATALGWKPRTSIELNDICSEVAALVRWKREQLECEGQWDIQAIGSLLNMKMGDHIREHIEPKIRELIKERDSWKGSAMEWADNAGRLASENMTANIKLARMTKARALWKAEAERWRKVAGA